MLPTKPKTIASVAAVSAALLLSGVALAGEPVHAWGGARTVVQAKHLVPAMAEGEGYGEKYTFDADFGDRGSMYFSLTISNLGLGDHKMEAKGRLTIDGKSLKWKKELDDDEWKYGKKPFYVKAGPAKLSGTPDRLVFEVEKGGKSLEFVFTPIARAWRPRGGQIHFGSDRKASDFTVFPLMKVEGKYNLGDGTKQISGRGYGSHTWSQLAIYEQARWTMEFRGIKDDYTIYMRQLATGGDYDRKTIPYLIVTKGDELLVEAFDFKFDPTDVYTDTKHDNRYKVPVSFNFIGVDSTESHRKFRGKVTKKKLKKRKDMLEDMNAAVRTIAGQYSEPVEYAYESDYVVEVKIGDRVERFNGVGRYEMYHWNK